MSNRRIQWARALAHGLVAVGLAGCASSGHEKNVQAAQARYHEMRARLMMPLALQQFETGDLDQANRTIQEAMQVDPDHPGFHVLAGRIAIEEGRLERGLNMFQRAIELDPKMPQAHYYQGLVLQRWNRLEEARACYEEAYQLEPDQPCYLLAVAQMLIALDRHEEAASRLESKLDYFEHNAGIRLALGQLCALRRDYARAIGYLQEAQLLQPDDPQILEELATAEAAGGRSADAIRHLELLMQQPGMQSRTDLKRTLAAACLGAGRAGDARQIYTDLTRQNPADAEAWLKLAEIAWSTGDLPVALQAAQRVIGLEPGRGDAYLLAGLVWQKQGRLEKSLELFEQGARAEPENARPLLLRGIALQQSGRTVEAAGAYREALRRQPDDPRTRQLLAQVESAR